MEVKTVFAINYLNNYNNSKFGTYLCALSLLINKVSWEHEDFSNNLTNFKEISKKDYNKLAIYLFILNNKNKIPSIYFILKLKSKIFQNKNLLKFHSTPFYKY